MVVATDAEQTSARPFSQYVFKLISYGSQAPRDSHMKWRHNSFPLKTQSAGGCPPFKPSARLKVVVASLSRALRAWRW